MCFCAKASLFVSGLGFTSHWTFLMTGRHLLPRPWIGQNDDHYTVFCILINQTVHYFITSCACFEYEAAWQDIPPLLPANLYRPLQTVICKVELDLANIGNVFLVVFVQSGHTASKVDTEDLNKCPWWLTRTIYIHISNVATVFYFQGSKKTVANGERSAERPHLAAI